MLPGGVNYFISATDSHWYQPVIASWYKTVLLLLETVYPSIYYLSAYVKSGYGSSKLSRILQTSILSAMCVSSSWGVSQVLPSGALWSVSVCDRAPLLRAWPPVAHQWAPLKGLTAGKGGCSYSRQSAVCLIISVVGLFWITLPLAPALGDATIRSQTKQHSGSKGHTNPSSTANHWSVQFIS